MSVQYRDGSFSENMPFDDAMSEFMRANTEGEALLGFNSSAWLAK